MNNIVKCAKFYKNKEKLKAYRKRYKDRYYNKYNSSVADNGRKIWTEDEINLLLTSNLPHLELAKQLGRSIIAIQIKKSRILKEQRMELGNLVFNPNTNQEYECPEFIIALLRDIERELKLTMFVIEHRDYESPFDNTGNSFRELKDIFEVQAYNWNDDEHQDYNFIFKTRADIPDIKISWYKYLGRDTTINWDCRGSESVILSLYNKCMEAIQEYRKNNENSYTNNEQPIETENSEWEMGNCTDNNYLFLNLKGNNDTRFSRFHLNITDAQKLVNDLDYIILNTYFEDKPIRIVRNKKK